LITLRASPRSILSRLADFFVGEAAEHRSLELCWLDEQSDSGRKRTITASQPVAYLGHERNQFAFHVTEPGPVGRI